MIDIHEARKLSTSNGQELRNSLPEWLEETVDSNIREDARMGRFSSRVYLHEPDGLPNEQVAAVMSAYADFCPHYFLGEYDAFFDFSWDNYRRVPL